MAKKVAVLLANGFEEVEALLTVDVLRRAGITCDTVSVDGGEMVNGAHGVPVKADFEIGSVDQDSYDMVVLPGGLPGADHLRDSQAVIAWVQSFDKNKEKYVAAICAAPQVLAKAGIANGRKVTSYPGDALRKLFREEDYVDDNAKLDEMVAVDGHLITSRGPATAFPFAYKLVEMLGGDAEPLREAMLYNALKQSIRNG